MKSSQVTPYRNILNTVIRGSVVLSLAVILQHYGGRVLGVRIELFTGLSYFGFAWFSALFLLPCALGIMVSFLYGLGGKFLSYFPPFITLILEYRESLHTFPLPDGAQLMPLGWWGFFVILAIESSAIGGIFGEIMNKRIYGRDKPPPPLHGEG